MLATNKETVCYWEHAKEDGLTTTDLEDAKR